LGEVLAAIDLRIDGLRIPNFTLAFSRLTFGGCRPDVNERGFDLLATLQDFAGPHALLHRIGESRD